MHNRANSGNRKTKREKPRSGNREAVYASDTDNITVEQVLLRHVNCRISAYLKSAYPDATWDWYEAFPEALVSEGGSGRIRLYGIPEYNYADVRIDRLARIECSLLKVVPLSSVGGHVPNNRADANTPADPEVWYNLQGKTVLEKCVAELHSHGHADMTIRENGDIYIRQGGSKVIHNTLRNMPGRSSRQALLKVFERDGLAASVTDEGIVMSW